jgi:hypothetical protein
VSDPRHLVESTEGLSPLQTWFVAATFPLKIALDNKFTVSHAIAALVGAVLAIPILLASVAAILVAGTIEGVARIAGRIVG